MISRIYYFDAQYANPLFLGNVYYLRNDCFWNMDFQKIHKIQGDKTTGDAHQFLNVIGCILAHHVYLLYGPSYPRYSHLDFVFGTWIYGLVHESGYAII